MVIAVMGNDEEPNFGPALTEAVEAVSELIAADGHPPTFGDKRLAEATDGLFWSEGRERGGRGQVRLEGPRNRKRPPPAEFPRRTDSAGRVAVAFWAYETALDSANDEIGDLEFKPYAVASSDDDFDDQCREINERHQGGFRRFLDELQVTDITEELLLWELHAAGSARHLDRLVKICDRIAEGRDDSVALGLCARGLFLALSGLGEELGPDCWVPAWTELPFHDAVLFKAALDAAQDLSAALSPAQAANAPTHHEAGHVLRVQQWLERRATTGESTTDLTAVSAWACWNLARRGDSHYALRAADTFSKLVDSKRIRSLPAVGEALHMAIAACYLRAGQPESAEPYLKRRCDIAEDEAKATFDLLRLYHALDRDEQLFDLFERYVRLQPEGGAAEVITSLALRFGLNAKKLGDRQDTLFSALMAAPLRDQAPPLVIWMDPFVERLSAPAQSRWLRALLIATQRIVETTIGDGFRSLAASDFAEVANMELKRRVFGPFWKANPGETAPELKDVRSGKGTLGRHLAMLVSAARPRDQAARLLCDWLKAHHPAINSFVASGQSKLRRLADLRNQAAHDEQVVTDQELRETFELARDFLRALTRS